MIIVTVCKECRQASCWQGIFMCWKSRHAGIIDVPLYELKREKREHVDYMVATAHHSGSKESATKAEIEAEAS